MSNEVLRDRYEVREAIGRGGEGVIHAAWDRRTERQVAVKFQFPRTFETDSTYFHKGEIIEEQGRKGFLLSGVTGIPSVLEYFEHRGRRCMVMDFIAGENLLQVTSRRPIRCTKVLASIVVQVCQALVRVHEKGIIHCDIKPQNIVVEEDGRLVLLDLGLAAYAQSPVEKPRGSVGYSPPEQYVPGISLGPQADIFALGCMLLEMCVMELPYDGFGGRPERHHAVLSERASARIPEEVRDLALRMVAFDPRERPSSAQEVFEKLRPLLPAVGEKRPRKPLSPDVTEYWRRGRGAR
ncbi:serine/threonine protein kinase [Streptomyces pinistramenti]|uniref:serine/threonine protein kinase n=1 Tax=Streptomyces pinistramenti TaxID=2884812 RepID=UPI001D074FA4|nr:serine/threonine-protein kinase [Streptomyces pinistramenti]MCB5909659.1 serine/threonine protein kinase [Streptomyces pinistramenti]